MYNDNEAMYEIRDLDEDIRKREELLQQLQAIPEESSWDDVADQLQGLQRNWKRVAYWDSAYEDKLIEEFEAGLDRFYGKRKALLAQYKAAKEDLIIRAKQLADSERVHQMKEEMKALMDEWKQVPSIGRAVDDALWEEFQAARQLFYDRKQAHWQDLQDRFAHALEVKQQLVEEAKALMLLEEWNETSKKYQELMTRWKEVGSAGKEHEDRLWEAFQANRQTFYDRRNAYYEQVRQQQEEKFAQKQQLIAQAKEIIAKQSFTREDTQAMKTLGVEWKQIGSCGKEKDDEVWNEFRQLMDAYFDGLTQWNQQRHMEWRQRMIDQKARKQELIQNQKRQIRRMQDEIVGLIGEKAIQDMEERIQEKEEFIKRLEEEVSQLEERLTNDQNK